MYSAKAAMALWALALLKRPPCVKEGHYFLLYTILIYYLLDCINMFVTGNYDGLGPMLIGLGIAMIIATAIHFRSKYKIIRREEAKKIGF